MSTSYLIRKRATSLHHMNITCHMRYHSCIHNHSLAQRHDMYKLMLRIHLYIRSHSTHIGLCNYIIKRTLLLSPAIPEQLAAMNLAFYEHAEGLHASLTHPFSTRASRGPGGKRHGVPHPVGDSLFAPKWHFRMSFACITFSRVCTSPT